MTLHIKITGMREWVIKDLFSLIKEKEAEKGTFYIMGGGIFSPLFTHSSWIKQVTGGLFRIKHCCD